MYKIVNREFGQLAYWPDNEAEANEWLEYLSAKRDEKYYVREL